MHRRSPIDTLEFQVWVAGEPCSYKLRHNVTPLTFGNEVQVKMPDMHQASWEWEVWLRDFHPLDGAEGDSWASVTAVVLGVDGVPYGTPRPQLIYCRPWAYPSLMVWPDSYRGPIVVTVRVPGQIGKDDGDGR